MLRRAAIALISLGVVRSAGCSEEPVAKPASTQIEERPAGAPAVDTPALEASAPVKLLHPTTLISAFGGTCYVGEKGKLRCFDPADKCIAEPPQGSFASISGTEEYACGLADDGALTCWGRGTTQKPKIARAQQVSVAKPHSCALASDASVHCWGNDHDGSLSVPDGAFTQVAVGHHHTCALRDDKSIACWGWNTSKQTEAPEGEFVFVSSGLQRSCAIRATGEIVCWGDDKSVPPGKFTQVALGGSRACALRSDGEVVCWGYRIDGFATMKGGPYVEVSDSCARGAQGEVTCFSPGNDNITDDGSSRYADAKGSCGPPPAPTGKSAPVVHRPWIAQAMESVRANDFDAIESGRDQVTKEDLPAFVEEYFKLTDWEDKSSLIDLVQDHHEAVMAPMMKDALEVPDCEYDSCWATRAVALSYFDGDFGRFMTYFEDHALAKKRIAERLLELK
jgi:hypothetical protein